MPSPIASPLRHPHVPTSPERSGHDRVPGSGIRSNSPASSPVNAHLSPRHRHAGAGMGHMPPRGGRLAGPAARLEHQVGPGAAAAGPSSPSAARSADLPTVQRRLDRWEKAATKAHLPPPPEIGVGLQAFYATKDESIRAARSAVLQAARTNATSLQIDGLQATRLPSAAIGELQGLEHLALKGTRCSRIDFTSNFTQINKLELTGNRELTMLPENIRTLQALTTLDIRMSPLLKFLPTGIGALPQLETLKVVGTSIKHLPITLTDLGNSLQTLEVSKPPHPSAENGLQDLPDNIGSLKSLTTLRLRYQEGLKELPASLGDLQKLETLDLSHCSNLTSLPDLSKLRNLKKLDLTGCFNLKPLPQSLAKLPADCEIIVPYGQQQQLKALRRASPQRQPAAAGTSSRPPSPPRFPDATAAQQQTLEGWKDQLKPFKAKGERGADRFNIWLGALLKQHGRSPDAKEKIQAVVDTAAQSRDFRTTLFDFAAANVEVPRNAFGVRQPDRATVTSINVHEVHNLLLIHQVTGPRLNARQASSNLKELARNDISFARELMTLASERPASPGRAGSPPAAVPPVLAAYVQAHDREGKEILEARRALAGRQGSRSSPDDAAAHAATLQVNDALLHGRHVAVAKQVLNAIDPRLFRPS